MFADAKRSFTALRSTIHASRSCGVDKHESALDRLPCEVSSRRQLLRLFVRKTALRSTLNKFSTTADGLGQRPMTRFEVCSRPRTTTIQERPEETHEFRAKPQRSGCQQIVSLYISRSSFFFNCLLICFKLFCEPQIMHQPNDTRLSQKRGGLDFVVGRPVGVRIKRLTSQA